MRQVLLTGFEPFDGDTVNPSLEVAQALHGATVGDAQVSAMQLPCVFGRASDLLHGRLQEGRWDLVLSLGLASNRSEITVERVAINIDDARIADNAGQQPVDRPVVPGAPAAYFTRLPIKRMVQAMRDVGVEAAVSQTAGTFVCNHVFYASAHWLALNRPAVRAGFIHLPPLPQQAHRYAGARSVPLDQQILGVRAALAAALADGPDLAMPAGAVA